MKKMLVTCESCHGYGKIATFKIDSEDTAHLEYTPCSNCGGIGHTEHAVFSIEEAKAILKHCGLSEE